MGFPVYDYRTDIRNLFVTPQIRSRFARYEPGTHTSPHTHDLGYEVFLVLEGRAVFEVAGDSEELGPGQMCIVLPDQAHTIRVVGNEPMTMYLSVTPHIQPTHTAWGEDGQRLPHRFAPSSSYEPGSDAATPFAEVADRLLQVTQAVVEAARGAVSTEVEMADTMKSAVASGDHNAASQAKSATWDALFPLYQLVAELASVWNDLAKRDGTARVQPE